jgi:hypothetical protein
MGSLGGKLMLQRLWCEDEGVLTFEWIMLVTLLVIGVIGGVAAIRDAILHEAQGTVGAVTGVDQSYRITTPLGVGVDSLTPAGGCVPGSSAVRSRFLDGDRWVNGRFDPTRLDQVNQTVRADGDLCDLP